MDARANVHSSADHQREMHRTGPDSVEPTSLCRLDRHEQPRAAGLPAISIMVGEPATAVEIAHRWAAQRGRSLLVVDDAETGSFAASWLDRLSRSRDLRRDAASWLARRFNRTAEGVDALLARKSAHELQTAPTATRFTGSWSCACWLTRSFAGSMTS
jgi:hypothetical protein